MSLQFLDLLSPVHHLMKLTAAVFVLGARSFQDFPNRLPALAFQSILSTPSTLPSFNTHDPPTVKSKGLPVNLTMLPHNTSTFGPNIRRRRILKR